MKIRIDITHEDARSGVPWSDSFCAIALAAKRVFDKGTRVRADYDKARGTMTLEVMGPGQGAFRAIRTRLPEVADFMSRFDHDNDRARAEFQPFSFEVEVP